MKVASLEDVVLFDEDGYDSGSMTGKRLEHHHEAFAAGGGVVYQNAATNDDWVVNHHATAVAGLISPHTNAHGHCAASGATLYYPNEGEDLLGLMHTVICKPSATQHAFEWLLGYGSWEEWTPVDGPILTVNESWGCIDKTWTCDVEYAQELEGVNEDYFAREYGVLVVKAAGNDNCVGPDQNQFGCPWTTNSLCVGSTNQASQMACHVSTGNYDVDREEPDVVAYGGDACNGEITCAPLTDFGGTSYWSGSSSDHFGTSLAAPIMSALHVLWRSRCEPNFQDYFDQKVARAVFRSAAFSRNPADGLYSTPSLSDDWQDGAGFVAAPDLMRFCDGTDGIFGLVPIDLTRGNQGTPGEWQPQSFTPGQAAQSLSTQDWGPVGNNPNRVWNEYWTFRDVRAGRIRATIAFDGCALEPSGTGPSAPAVDFDFFLRKGSNPGTLVAWSQSVSDTNEGWDFQVTDPNPNDYTLIITWPVGAESCDGTTNDLLGLAGIHLE